MSAAKPASTLSSVPEPGDTIKTTLEYSRPSSPDAALDIRNREIAQDLARLYHKEDFNEFEPFLFEAGLSQGEITEFRKAVFLVLPDQKFITDPDALMAAISLVFIKFFDDEKRLVEIADGLEQAYLSLQPAKPIRSPQKVVSAVLVLPMVIKGILDLIRECR